MHKTSLDEVMEFLSIVSAKGFLNENTALGRRNACSKFFEILEEDQKYAEYVLDNLQVVKARFLNLHPEVTGNTVDQYTRRVEQVLKGFFEWKADRTAWERSISAKQNARSAGEGEKKPRVKVEKPNPSTNAANDPKPDVRELTFPVRPNFNVFIKMPASGFKLKDFQKLGLFLLPYVEDLEASQYPRSVFLALGKDEAA